MLRTEVARMEPLGERKSGYGVVFPDCGSTPPPDGICNPVRNGLCNGRTVVCGHNVRVGFTNPGPLERNGFCPMPNISQSQFVA